MMKIKRRPWYKNVAGKLLIAFTVIVALTVAGTGLSVIQLSGLRTVVQRLTGFSIPAVKASLSIETNATQLAVSAAQLGSARDGVELFTQTDKIATQVQELWANLASLRSILGDTAATQQLQILTAAIDSKVGELNRAVTDRIALADGGQQSADALIVAIETLSAQVSRLQTAPSSAPTSMAIIADLARQVMALSGLTARVATAATAGEIAAARQRVAAAREELDKGIAALLVIDAGAADLNEAARAALDQFDGPDGLLAAREKEFRSSRTIAGLQQSLEESGADLRQQVRTLVAEAERDSTASAGQSLSEIDESRLWLSLIATLSLILAVLIVWLLVFRYVVARLSALSGSMLAIAHGDFDAEIPAGKADEIGDMRDALVTFRDNAREIRSAREEAEKARAEAEAASHTKSAFLANMSHELRTPLNAIIGYSEILAEDAADAGDEASLADLKKIQGAGRHLLGLINDILDLSKIEAGRMDVYLEQVFLTPLVNEVKTIIEPMVLKNGNSLSVDIPDDIGSLRTDMTKLKQSLINLLSNAAKFTKEGNIALRVSRRLDGDGISRVTFAVSDSGIGMTDEQVGRLFQAFTQADASMTRNFGGTGLGLTITKHFCEMLGGSIEVVSKQGAGSTFTLVLPDQVPEATAAETPHAAALKKARPAASPSAVTVLIVDDDPGVHEMLAATLGRSGFSLIHATDGAEALSIMRRNRPDVVTLDVMMPKMDGWSVLGAMKADPDLESIPVIMLTIVDDRNLGFSLGASEFMTKPVDRNKLVSLLRKFSPSMTEGTVLVVEDDDGARHVIKSTIESEGLAAAEAVNGRRALDWLAGNPPPALILLDLMMPEMDGFEFLERLRERPDLSQVPVVVLTAKDLTESERDFLAARTMLVLSKSAQPISSLGAALAAIAGRQRK